MASPYAFAYNKEGNQSRLLRRIQDGFAWHGPLCGDKDDSVKTPCR